MSEWHSVKNSKKGFTLSEVMLVLSVIGVIAALTIPGMLVNFQKRQTVTKLQKVYSLLSQAIRMSEDDNGALEYWDYNDSVYFMNTYIAPYLKVLKNCGTSNTGCWSDTKINYLNASSESVASYAKTLLNDGIFLALFAQGPHTHFYVDIDGKNGRNTYGKDVFIFTLTPTSLADGAHLVTKPGLYAFGSGVDRNTLKSGGTGCNNTGGSGSSCTALIIYDSWQIKDDYPY